MEEFNYIDAIEIIGKRIRYSDYVGEERYGTIIAFEPYPFDSEVVYVYIEDEIGDKNIYSDIVNGSEITYADIKLSSEIIIEWE